MSSSHFKWTSVVVTAIFIVFWQLGPFAIEFGLRALSEAGRDEVASELPEDLEVTFREAWERVHQVNDLDQGPLPHGDFARLGPVQVHYVVTEGIATSLYELEKRATIKVDTSRLSQQSVLILGSKHGVVWDVRDIDLTLIRAIIVSANYGQSNVRGIREGARVYYVDEEDRWRFYAPELLPECAYDARPSQYLCWPSYGLFDGETFPFDALDQASETFFGRRLDSYLAVVDSGRAEVPGMILGEGRRRDLVRERDEIERRLAAQRAMNRKAERHARADRTRRLEDMAKARTNRASVDLGRLRHEDVKVYAVTAEGLHDIKMMYHPQELLHASPEGSDSVVFYSPFQVCVLTSRPVLLALTSDDPTFWQVRLGPHADLRGVLVLSKSTSLVEGPPASVGVTYLSEDAGDEVPAGFLRDDKDRAALASYLTGHLGKTDLEIRTLSFVSGLQEVIADGPGVETPSRRIVREPPDIPPDCTNVVG